MPGVIDSLVVALNLDASGLVKGSKDVVSSVEKTKMEVVKHGTAIEGAVKKASESFEGLAGKALAAFAIFAGAKSVEQFTRQITTLDAAVGRLSGSMGQTPEDIDAIGKSVARMGGSADVAMNGMRSLSDAFEQFRTTGSSAIMEPLARLQGLSGKAIKFGTDVKANFLSIADALKAEADKGPQGKTLAHYLGRQILGSDDLTNLAIQGGNAVNAAMAQSARHGVTNPQDVEAAQKLQAAFVGVSQTVVGIGTKIETALTPYLTKLLGQLDEWLIKNKDGLVAQVQKAVEDFGKAVSEHQADIKAFGDEVVAVAVAAARVAEAFGKQSPAMQALEAFGAAALLQVNGPLATLARAMVGLGLMNPAVLGTIGLGAVLASGDPNKSVLAGGRPDVAPQDNDLGLPGTGGRSSDTGDAKGKLSGAWGWFTSKMQAMGFGDRLKKDDRAADAAVETAEGVKALVKQGERAAGGTADAQGVTASSGGLGGSGHHTGGQTSPGASLRDRQYHGKGNFGQKGWWTPERQSYAVDYLMKHAGLTEDGAKALVSRWRFVESAGGPTSVNPKSGARGIAQWLDRHPKGDTGSFDDQLGAVAGELNGSEGRAKKLLNTPGMEANGASAYERAEGWNARTNTDNYTGTVREGMKHIAHGAATTPGAGTPAPSGAAVTDSEVFAARQRILNGSRDPRDRALVDRYKAQQTKPEKTSFLDGLYKQAPAHVAGLAAGAQMAAHSAHITTTHHNDNSSETHIAKIEVHTGATDAHGIAADIGPALKRGQRAAKANYGLA